MKRLIYITIAALAALTACSKVDDTAGSRKEISFTVANRIQTKAIYSTDNHFGTYAWYTANAASVAANTGSDHTEFMINETVGYVGSVWKTTENTFYWPKTGSIDFISYSPFDGTNGTDDSNPAVTQSTITYTGIDVTVDATHPAVDYMYADKVNCAINVNTVPAHTAVPTVFRHALAKLSFKIAANFITDGDATNPTTWDVYVKSVKISGFKTTGDCALTLNTDGTSWDKPVTNIGTVAEPKNVYIWNNLSGSTGVQELIEDADVDDPTKWVGPLGDKDNPTDINPASGFVMPQQLLADTQRIELALHITTHLSNGLDIEEDYDRTLDLKDLSSLKAWEMNQNIVYNIQIKPVAYYSTYDNPNDVIIKFDPTVADWADVNATAIIQI